jgi:hypothetical protein
MDPGRLHVLSVGTGIADMRVREGNDLPTVRRIREDLLVAGHCGIENDFTYGFAVGTDRGAMENGAILQSQYSRRTQMQTSVRNSTENPKPDHQVISAAIVGTPEGTRVADVQKRKDKASRSWLR